MELGRRCEKNQKRGERGNYLIAAMSPKTALEKKKEALPRRLPVLMLKEISSVGHNIGKGKKWGGEVCNVE